MIAAMALFAVNDALVKAFASNLPVAETMGIRGLFATLITGGFILLTAGRAGFAGVTDRLVTLRSIGEAIAVFCLLSAVIRLPIGDVTAVSQAVPVAILAGGALFLGERATLLQWFLVLVGLAGILMIAKPGSAGFDPAILLVLVTMVCFAFRDLSARRIGRDIPASAVAFSTVAIVTAIGLAVTLVTGSVLPAVGQIAALALAGLLLAVGQAAIVMAYRWASVAEAGPFNYSKTGFAVVIGIVAFGERPDLFTLVGVALIVGSGLAIALSGRHGAR